MHSEHSRAQPRLHPLYTRWVRLAVIADIHGNLDALEAVLQDLQPQGIDRLYINGDVVNRGPDSVACMRRVLEWSHTDLPQPEFTLGNHDDLMLLWQARSPLLPAEWTPTRSGARRPGAPGSLSAPECWLPSPGGP